MITRTIGSTSYGKSCVCMARVRNPIKTYRKARKARRNIWLANTLLVSVGEASSIASSTYIELFSLAEI